MDLPYHAISDSEADELADELAQVLLSIGGNAKASEITNAKAAGAALGRINDDMDYSFDM